MDYDFHVVILIMFMLMFMLPTKKRKSFKYYQLHQKATSHDLFTTIGIHHAY